MTNTTEKKYAKVVNPQINPNNSQQNEWKNIHNAVGNTDLYATSHFTKEKVSNKDKKTGKVTTSYKYNRPYKVTAHDFKLNIPSNAKIKNINVAVRMKTSKDGTDSVFPAVGFYIKEGGKKVATDVGRGETGWHNGVYWAYSKKKLSTTVHSASYSMSGEDFYKGGYTVANLNSSLCGVDLYFHGDYTNQTVSLMYVYMTVEYIIPTYLINTDPTSTETNPYKLKSGVKKNVKFIIKQTEDLPDTSQQMKLIVPWGTVLDGHITTKTTSPNITSFVTDTENVREKIWNIRFGTSGTATMTVPIIDYTIDDQILRLRNVTEPTPETPIPHKRLYYRTVRNKAKGYEDVTITHEYPVRKRHTTCFQVDTVAQSDDDYVEYRITNNHPYHFVKFTVNTELSDSRVKLLTTSLSEADYSANDGITVRFEVPPNEKVSISYDVCIRPFDLGANIFQVGSSDSTLLHKSYYDVLNPYVYHIGATENDDDENIHLRFNGERINFTNHRIASNLETGAFILPCHVKDVDSVMIQSKPSIRMYKWEEVDYIGCVPLEHLHFNPKSTYKDKLLDSHYKNKRYMGKELASDEDISLNVRVHPQQVTTLQGLVDMDKPIPINANHRCFEGDALNHRGWAEIYSIKAEETNPHWYKCDIDVKYLTHNLNTRFHISKGDKTFNYPIPSLLTEVQKSGDKLDSLNNEDDFFIVDTDGTYAYIADEFEWEDVLDYQGNSVKWIGGSWNNGVYTGTEMTVENEDGSLTTLRAVKSETETVNEILEYLEEQNEIVKPLEMNKNIQVYEGYTIDDNLKNRFTLDEGQHISIKSRNKLSNNSKIEVTWGSSKLSENQENAISRITRLIDEETDDIVFEYEYCDFDFSDFVTFYDQTTEEVESLLRCRVIGRRKDEADYDVVYDGIIDLQSDVETSEESYVSDEDLTEHTDIKYYGSSLIFELSGNLLNVIDEGYNGKEVEIENIKLEGKSYYWETYWVNKNTDGEDNDIIAYFDVTVQDSILESKYSPMYSSMYISPFPVNGKQILFTRDGEEGVIYYLKEDDQEFSYLIEPYYQYHNGVDLRTSVDSESYISIFNLNYGYKVIYLENGLVSLGINRLNGDMYLRRYNKTLKEYVTLYRFKLNKFEDVNINSISDDRIELQASDTTIIMYRGHPYVILRHPTEDIAITTKSYQVYGQSVDETANNFPIYFDLMNRENLLSDCVTKKLDDDCINISEHEITGLDTKEIKLRCNNQGDLFEDDIIVLEVLNDDDTQFHDRVCLLMKKDDDNGYDVIECGANPTSEPHLFTYRATKKGTYSFIAVYTGDEQYEYSISDTVSVSVGQVYPTFDKPEPSGGGGGTTGDYVLLMNCPSEMSYRDGTKVVFTLLKGGKPVKGKTIEMTDFNYTNTSMTDKNGQVSFSNNRAKNHAGKWKLGAKFWNGGKDPHRSVYKDVTVKKAVPEFHLNHEAKDTKGSFSVNLRDSKNHNIKLAKRNIVIKVDNKEHKRVTNSNGSEAIAIKDKGTHKYICTFDGDKNYEKCKFKYREYVKKAE